MHKSGPRARRRAASVVAFVALIGLLTVNPGLVAPHSTEEVEQKGPDDVKLITAAPESEAKIWPFTSRQRSFESLTLPINVLVRGDASRIVAQLSSQRDGEWERTSRDWQGIASEGEPLAVDGTDVQWRETTGATRYTYVAGPSPEDGWMTETAQLHDGSYFGSRYHLRLYEGGRDARTWTAIQAHHEHWDWFRLRHSVGSLAMAQDHLESQYSGKQYVASVDRDRFANGGISDANGWATVVDLRSLSAASALATGILFFGSLEVGRFSREPIRKAKMWLSTSIGQRSVLLFVVLFALPLFVRNASIAAEAALTGVPVKAITATLYPVLVVGIPLAAILIPHGGEPFDWAALAVLGLGSGFVLDYQLIGIDILPIAVVLHRILLLGIVGLLAAAASYRTPEANWNYPLTVGVVLWIGVLAWPLFLGL